jgi:hypothetical protein
MTKRECIVRETILLVPLNKSPHLFDRDPLFYLRQYWCQIMLLDRNCCNTCHLLNVTGYVLLYGMRCNLLIRRWQESHTLLNITNLTSNSVVFLVERIRLPVLR